MNKKLHQAYSIAGHLIHSRSRYGVHSPFVYDLITKARKAVPGREEQKLIREIQQTIKGTAAFRSLDMGTGNNRMLNGRDLLRMSISMRYGKLLYGICRYFRPQHVLELGTSAGLSTAFLAMASRSSEIITIEGCPKKSEIAKSIFAKQKISNITTVTGDAHEQIELLKKENYKADLIFIDAEHTYEGSKQFFSALLPLTTKDSLMIFDDIYWSEGMSRAWKEITADARISLSLAGLRFGIIFFRKGIAKQHFRLRL